MQYYNIYVNTIITRYKIIINLRVRLKKNLTFDRDLKFLTSRITIYIF